MGNGAGNARNLGGNSGNAGNVENGDQCLTVRPSLSVRPFVQLLYFFYTFLNDLIVLYLK